MKHFFFFVFTFLSTFLIGQEQITNILGSGTSENYVFKEYMNKKYMLSFDKFDNITTYEMTEDSLRLINSRKIDGAKEITISKTTGKFLLFENTEASIAYNFVDDEIKYFEYGFGIEKGYWDARYLENQVILTHSLGINKGLNSFYIDLTNGIKDTLIKGFSTLGLTEDFIFGRMFSADSISFDLVNYNKLTKNYQLIFTFPKTTKRYHYINGLVIYDDVNKIYAYNVETGDHDLIYEHDKEFRSFTIYEIGNHIGLTFTNIANSEAELYDLKLIDLSDFSIQNLSISDAVSYIYHQQVHGKIIYQEKDKIFVHDLATDSRMNFNTNHNSLYHVAGDQYLVHLHYDTLKVVDILSKKELRHTVPITFESSFFSIKSIKINDKYILNIYNNNENDKRLYQIDLTNQIVSNYEFEPYAPNGLTVRSNIVLNDGKVLLFDKDLYAIEGNVYVKLNTAPLGTMRHLPYRITDGILYWIQENENNLDLYQYFQSVVSKVGEIKKSNITLNYPQNLIDFAVISGDIFYIEGYIDGNLYKIKKGSITATRIDNVDQPTSTYQLMIHEGNLYYAKGGTVRVILQDETMHNTFLSVDPAAPFEKIILNDKM